jgi:hypothetical protein
MTVSQEVLSASQKLSVDTAYSQTINGQTLNITIFGECLSADRRVLC